MAADSGQILTSTRGKTSGSHRQPGAALLQLIGAFKLAKAFLLLCGGVAALAFSPADIGTKVADWIRDIHLDPGSRFLRDALAHLTGVPARRLHELGVAMFIYSALFCVEGVGLVLLEHWAEWVALISTAGLIPVEIYELCERTTILRAVILAINAAVVAYLFIRLRRDHKIRAAAKLRPLTPNET
jgi:uncharacterized membrane protein (DUF2068 family)